MESRFLFLRRRTKKLIFKAINIKIKVVSFIWIKYFIFTWQRSFIKKLRVLYHVHLFCPYVWLSFFLLNLLDFFRRRGTRVIFVKSDLFVFFYNLSCVLNRFLWRSLLRRDKVKSVVKRWHESYVSTHSRSYNFKPVWKHFDHCFKTIFVLGLVILIWLFVFLFISSHFCFNFFRLNKIYLL